MVAVIALGLAIDDTIHLMSKYRMDMRELQDSTKGITASIRSELRPVLSTSVSLSILFFVLTISNLVNIQYFGILSGAVILYAFFCDIFFTTMLLSRTQLLTIFDLFSIRVQKEVLNSTLLKGLKLRQVKELLLLGAVRNAHKGKCIIHQGEVGSSINILLEGEVEVSSLDKSKNKRVVFTTLKKGDVIGEIAVVMPVPRSADIIAKTNIEYFEIDERGLERIAKLRPGTVQQIYHNIAGVLGDRLLKLNKKYMHDID